MKQKIREYHFPLRENADVYFAAYAQNACQLFLILFSILMATAICAAFFIVELFLLLLVLAMVCGCAALFAHLCHRNILLVMESESIFVYRTMFGNVYEFRFDEIKNIKLGVGGIKIVCPNKKIYIDNSEIVSEKFRNKLSQVRQRIEGVDLSKLPDPAKKTDQLKQTFYRRK